jgi:hypothetical protein
MTTHFKLDIANFRTKQVTGTIHYPGLIDQSGHIVEQQL